MCSEQKDEHAGVKLLLSIHLVSRKKL